MFYIVIAVERLSIGSYQSPSEPQGLQSILGVIWRVYSVRNSAADSGSGMLSKNPAYTLKQSKYPIPVFVYSEKAAVILEPASLVENATVNDSPYWFVHIISTNILEGIHQLCAWLCLKDKMISSSLPCLFRVE